MREPAESGTIRNLPQARPASGSPGDPKPMPTMRHTLSSPSVRLLRALACASLLAFRSPACGQAATPAVSTLVAFSASDPNGGIVVGGGRGLYGTTSSASSITGGLILPQCRADGSSVKTLHQMSTSEAYAPLAGLLVGSDGLLYGTTSLGAVGVTSRTRPAPCSASRPTAPASRSCIASSHGRRRTSTAIRSTRTVRIPRPR